MLETIINHKPIRLLMDWEFPLVTGTQSQAYISRLFDKIRLMSAMVENLKLFQNSNNWKRQERPWKRQELLRWSENPS